MSWWKGTQSNFYCMSFFEYLKYILLLLIAPRSLKTMEWRMLRLLNKDRKAHGLSSVRMQDDLRHVARTHSTDMAKKDYFDHVNMQAQSHVDRLMLKRITDVVSGENLAKIGGYANPTQVAEVGLMESPGHRANILNGDYNVVGIGVTQSNTKIYYFTQLFAKRGLILTKRPPHSFSLKRGLRLKGIAFPPIHTILYQIKKPHEDKIIQDGFKKLSTKKFDLRIFIQEPGNYQIFLYVQGNSETHFSLANNFTIKVRRPFLS